MEQEYVYEKSGRRRKAVRTECTYCGDEFLIQERFEKSNERGNYCSRSCSSEASRKRTNITCHICGKEFERVTSKLNKSKSGLVFCSRACKDFAQSIEGGCKDIQPEHYKDGIYACRKKAFSKLANNCNRCGYDEVAGVLMVHHRDRNRSNNDLNNLEILCPTCHYVEHFQHKDGMYRQLKI